MIFVEGLDDLLDVLKQMAPVLVLLSTTIMVWWRSAHVGSLERRQPQWSFSSPWRALIGDAALFSFRQPDLARSRY